MKNIIYSFILVFALFLTGCADAGKNQTVNSGDLVTLDASASTPSHGGKIKKYTWKQVRGKRVKLSNKRAEKPTFTAPNLNKKSRLLFRVTAFEYGGHPRRFRSYDYVRVTVLPKTEETDTTAPVITLNGEETITLTKGDTYKELGATATDNKDGNLTASIVIAGLVDTSTEGNYTVTYNVSDTAGNASETVTRTVTVILPADTTPPVITLNGGEVTLTVGETYIELGATATDDRDTAVEVNISSNVDTSTPGTYTVTYTANDTAGNTAVEVTRNVSVILPEDIIPPVITLNGEETITLTKGNVYEELGATAIDNKDGDLTTSIVIDGLVDTSTEGNYTVTYNVSDANGNAAEEVTRTVTVILPADITPPVITLNGGDVALLIGEVYTELGAIATDDRDAVVDVNISSNVDTSTAGTYTVTYTAKDHAGNEATPLTRNVTVNAPQNIAPIAVITVDKTEIKVGDTVHFSAEESTDEDGQIVNYSWKDDVENVVSTESNFTHTFTQTGNFGIKLIVIDNDGTHGLANIHINVSENNDTNTSENSVVGTITDIAGNGLNGVKVYSSSHETFTNADGYYVLETNGTSPVSIVAELRNYIQNSQVVDIDVNATQNFTLVFVDKIEIFDSEVGMEIKTKGAKVNFPASSVAYKDGTAYIGKVTTKVAYNRVTSDIGQAAFPGEYIGETTEGNTTILRSYGFIDVTMEDNISNTLKVADGSSVTLTFPMDDNIDVKPATIPLWYYDTKKGIWVEDGVATYDESTNSYSGDVTHFTTWNLDAKMNPGSLKGCVEDSDGNPITNALLNIEGAGWRSGLKQNTGNRFEFLRAPTGMAVSLTAYTTEGISQTQTITLAPNEHRVMADCLMIENNTTSPIVNVKGRLVNLDGDLITDYASITITDTDTGANIASVNFNNGIINMSIVRPDNNKITITIRVNNQNIIQSYLLDPNNTTLNIGDISLDFVKITTHFFNRDGDPVEIVNDASITISSVSGAYISDASTSGATRLTSPNFIRPANNTVNLEVTYDGYVIIFDDNITIEGTITNKNIVIPGINLHGTILLRNGDIFSEKNSILIYDPNNLDKVLGWAKANNDGTFTTSYFIKPSSDQILLRVRVDSVKVDTLITLTDDTTVEVGDIETNLGKITGNLTNYSYEYPNYTLLKILDTDNNNTYLGYANVTSNGSISSKFINMPDSGNITLIFRKNRLNNVWVRNYYHFDTNESLDVGTVTLENASVTGTLTYLDGETMPEGISIRTFNSDYVEKNSYSFQDRGTITLENGQMDTQDFYKPSNGQIKLVVGLKGDEYNVTIDLDDTNQVTNKDLSIDAIIITGTALYPHDNTPANGFSFSSSQTTYPDYLGTSDINGTFTLGPILRPNDTNITLVAQRYTVQGYDKGSTVNISAATHITNIGDYILNTSFIKGCVVQPDSGFSSFKVRYNDPFARSDLQNYPIQGDVNITDASFDMMIWQTDTNNSLYVFAVDTVNKKTTKALTFTANTPVVDYTNPCIDLEDEVNTTKNIDVSVNNASSDAEVIVYYSEQRSYYNGTNLFQSSSERFNFDITKNGLYTLKMLSPSSNYSGIVHITVDGGIPISLIINGVGASPYSSRWILYEIEVYQGNITIHTINEEEQIES